MEALRERLAALSRAQMVGLVVVVAVALGGAGLWYMRSLPQPVRISGSGVTAPEGASGTAGVPTAATASPSPEPLLIVDVAGWVRTPGVYEFSADDRVIDAIEAAGGVRKGAEVTTLNLASPLTDGVQILVPPPATRTERAEAASGAPSDETGKVNINTADATDLESLSGIGEVLAASIVDYREKNGPFDSIEQLEDVSGIGPATLEEIRADVTL